MAKKKTVTLYNPARDEYHQFEKGHAERLLAYQEKVNSRTRFELVKEKPKKSKADADTGKD